MRTGHRPRGISTRGPELQTQIMRIIFVNISQLNGEDEEKIESSLSKFYTHMKKIFTPHDYP